MFFYRYPLILLSLFPLVNLMDVFLPSDGVAVSGYWLLPMDPVYFFTIIHLGVCALLQPGKMASVLRENFFLTIFLAIVALYVVLDTPVYGQSAIGEARKFYFMFLIPFVASVSIRKAEDLRRFVLIVVFAATCVTVVALAGAVQGSIVKFINSKGALIVTLAAFAMLIHRIYRIVIIHPIVDRLLVVLFFIIALGQGHRTVWLAVGFGLVLALCLYRIEPRVVAKLLIVAVVILAGLATVVTIFPQAGSTLIEYFAGIRDPYSDATASWRIEGWQQQIDRLQKEGRLLFGEGLGGYYSWLFRGYDTVTTSPHNAYVQMILKFGLFGLMIYGFLACAFFSRTLPVRKRLNPAPMRAYVEMGILNFGAAHGYMLGYGFEPIMLIFFAVATSAAKLPQEALRHFQESRLRRSPTDLRIPPRPFRPHRRPEAQSLHS